MSKKKALVVLGDGIGNLIEQSPLVKAAAEKFAQVDVWTPRTTPGSASVLKGLPRMRRLYTGRPVPPESYDFCFYSVLVAPWAKQAITSARFGMRNPRDQKDQSETEIALEPLRRAGFSVKKTPKPYCAVSPWKGALPRPPFVGLCAGGNPKKSWRLKRYPHWAEVVKILWEAGYPTVLLGAATDDPVAGEGVLNLQAQTTITEAAWIAQRCSVFLANDCGLSHVAATVGTPTVIAFGPTWIKKNLPASQAEAVALDLDCQPCQYGRYWLGRRRDGSHCQHECLMDLAPSRLADRALSTLGASPA